MLRGAIVGSGSARVVQPFLWAGQGPIDETRPARDPPQTAGGSEAMDQVRATWQLLYVSSPIWSTAPWFRLMKSASSLP